MSWRKEQRRAERGYHHGNLKEALLQAALGLIAEKGAAGFTFADAARMAGVSPAAPYRHFRDRDELLSSIAQRGFEQFEALLTQAWTTAVLTPSRRSSGSAKPISPLPAMSRRSILRCSNPAFRSISAPHCRRRANAPSR
jgi:AcrR family transcriptional regulator